MTDGPIPSALSTVLSRTTRRLRTARREALAAIDVEETEWEYAGRTWSWPTGEGRTYFHELAPGETAVLEAAAADHGLDLVGVGTGRVVVRIPPDRLDDPVTVDGPGDGGTRPDGPRPGAVAKLARYGPSAEMGDGRAQNREEKRVWEGFGTYPFLPVLDADADGDWIAMPRATVPPPAADHEDAVHRVRAALAGHGDAFHFDELKPENVGAYRGRYWVVDYGRPPGDPLFVEPP